MDFKINSRSSLRQKFLGSIFPCVASQLGISSKNFFLQVFITSKIDVSGLTPLEAVDGSMLMFLNSNLNIQNLGVCFCHEMVHVKQVLTGRLRSANDGYMWSGKFYGDDVKYLDRPWEIQAYEKQEIIFRRALEVT